MRKILGLIVLLTVISCGSDKKENGEGTIGNLPTKELQPLSQEELSKYDLAYNKALELWGCDYEELKVATSFGDAQVIEAGKDNKEVLVLLHGMNASSTMWYPNVKELSKKYRVYAIDFLLEPGKSERKIEVNSTASIMRWYTEIFDSLGLDEFSIVGASRGGWLGVNLALKYPARIKNLMLLSPAQTFKWIPIGKDLFTNLVYNIAPKRKNLRKSLKSMSSDVDNIKQDYIDLYYMSIKRVTISKVFIEMRPFKENELRSLKMPVLVLIGDEDFINNSKSLTKAKNYIRNVDAETIKNAGHFLSFDQSEIVNARILRFMEEN